MILAAVRHEVIAAEQWDAELVAMDPPDGSSGSEVLAAEARRRGHSLLALTGWLLAAIGGLPLRRVGQSDDTATSTAVGRRVDMADVLARVCLRPVTLTFVATAAAVERLLQQSAQSTQIHHSDPVPYSSQAPNPTPLCNQTQRVTESDSETQRETESHQVANWNVSAAVAAAASAPTSSSQRETQRDRETEKAILERRAWLREATLNGGTGFTTGAVCHGWLGKQPKGVSSTANMAGGVVGTSSADGSKFRRKRKWAARYVALHCHCSGGTSSWTLSWAKKPSAESASGKVVLCDRCVLLPATGLCFGIRTPKRALRLQASDARTLAKWLAVLASALDDDVRPMAPS
eukprot:COSAG03_NODE_1322_length_4325_cov_24.045906_1_plen_348_part_00